ncbi:MAG: hypothetical protein QXU98_07090 [Candidatus Parvarchaeota archaeon]
MIIPVSIVIVEYNIAKLTPTAIPINEGIDRKWRRRINYPSKYASPYSL